MNLDAVEGRLAVRLGPGGAALSFAPPLAAARVFAGRTVAEVLMLLPQLFAVCGRAHSAAASAAVEAARGEAPSCAVALARGMVVDAEALREHLLRILLGWGSVLERRVHPVILSDVMALPERVASALGSGGTAMRVAPDPRRPCAQAADALESTETLLARQVLGCSAADWLRLEDTEAMLALAGSGALGPRFLQWLATGAHAASGAAVLPALPGFTREWLAAHFGGDGTGAATPDWHGTPCETGSYARQRAHPLVRAASARWGHGLAARSVARLVEVAALAVRLRDGESARIAGIGDGATGYGVVETARGRLAHRISLEGDTVRTVQILAPTQWNCHPRGVMAAALGTLPFDAHARLRGTLVVECIDPCVGYVVEVGDGA